MNLVCFGSSVLLCVLTVRLNKRITFFVSPIMGGLLVSQNIGYMFNLVENFYEMFEGLRSGISNQSSFYYSVLVALVIAAGGMASGLTKGKQNSESLEIDINPNDLLLDN
jgi:hypothetical protein